MSTVLEAPVETKNDTVKSDFAAEVAEWLEAFDQVVAADDAQAADILGALRQRAGEVGGDG